MAKKDVIEEFSKIKGVGKKKAEALYENGFTSVDKLQKAKTEDITKVDGFSDNLASDILKQMKKEETSKEEKTKKTPEEKQKKPKQEIKSETKKPKTTKKETKAEKEEETVEYVVKKKPKLEDEVKRQLITREKIKNKRPKFLRQESFRYKRLSNKWHKPRGLTSKMRINKGYRPNRVRVGFRSPQEVRGLHPSGFEEVMVFNVKDLKNINPEKQAARIGGTVGTKKRVEIYKKAEELDIRILNK